MDDAALIAAVKDKRWELRLTQEELIRRLGISRTTWFETMRTGVVGRAFRLAALRVLDADQVLSGGERERVAV